MWPAALTTTTLAAARTTTTLRGDAHPNPNPNPSPSPNQVIKGWTEAMPMMVEGDKWELYIPSDMVRLRLTLTASPSPCSWP